MSNGVRIAVPERRLLYAVRIFFFPPSKAKRCTHRSVTDVRYGSATSGGERARGREGERAEGESPPKIALVRVFSRDPIRGGLTNRGKPRYSSSRRYRCSLYPIPFPLSRDNVRNRAPFAKSYPRPVDVPKIYLRRNM